MAGGDPGLPLDLLESGLKVKPLEARFLKPFKPLVRALVRALGLTRKEG